MTLNLSYIPSKYWTADNFFCEFLNKKKTPPQDSSFFIMWDELIEEEGDLDKTISQLFPSIPVRKLLSCKIHLVVSPRKFQINQKEYLPLTKVLGKVIPIPPLLKILFGLNLAKQVDRSHISQYYSDSVKTWAILIKFSMEILLRGNFVPKLEKIKENQYQGQWSLLLKGEKDYRRFNKLIKESTWAGLNLPIDIIPGLRLQKSSQKKSEISLAEKINYTTGLWHPSFLFTDFLNHTGDYFIRSFLQNGFYQKFAKLYQVDLDPTENSCVLTEDSPWDLRFLDICIGKTKDFDIERFCDTPIPNILRNWVQNAQGFSYSLGVNLTFRLEYPETPDSDWDLGFYIQPLQNLENFISLMDIWDGIVTYQEEYKNVCSDNNILQEEILRALGTAAKLYPPIRFSLEGKNPHHVKISKAQVMNFLKQGQYFLSQAGFKVILPEEFQHQGEQRLSARMVIKSVEKTKKKYADKQVNNAPVGAGFDMESMLEFHWEAKLGQHGEQLTENEFSELVQSEEPLIYWRGNWVMIYPQDMESLRPIFQKQKNINGEISYEDALKLGLAGNIQLRENGTQYEVILKGDFSEVVSQLQSIDHFEEIETPNNFNGVLRSYQEIALTWLVNMTQYNFGVILADDMGLGKTVEVLAFLRHLKNVSPKSKGSIIIVCPTSLIFNWKREIMKFCPDFDVVIHHGPSRPKEMDALEKYTVPYRFILTTYGTIRNDIEFLDSIIFAGIILDESQNIKNYNAQQTQAILKLQSRFKIALSGTPIENRLLELWTLFRFLNPGLLGTQQQFKSQFSTPIERFQDDGAAEKLKKFVSPFLMRRLKSDKNIIKDLPEKNEIKQYLNLSATQSKLYSDIVQYTLKELEEPDIKHGKRKGLVLKLLMQTKQICNHPFQYLHIKPENIVFQNDDSQSSINEIIDLHIKAPENEDNSEDAPQINISSKEFIKSSIKLQRLIEMIDEVLEEGEKILIFTQFRQMGDLLKKIFEEKYSFNPGWFHGGLSAEKRQDLVDNFQSTSYNSTPILILSLKAGGTGLNLTQASTVFHFDRWWNPAVEDQATDRAYRIGQEQRVNVYKFIATGTIEEKIDTMLEQKRDLADSIIGSSGETWITDLSNDELKNLFSLNVQEHE